MSESIKDPKNLNEVISALQHYSLDQKWPNEKILQEICGAIGFPKNELRLKQAIKLKNLIPEFQEILLKGLHSLDYLALLANCSREDQKIFYENLVKKYRINYNNQKKLFEWLYDWAQRDFAGSISKAIEVLRNAKNLEDLTANLFTKRFPIAHQSQVRS